MVCAAELLLHELDPKSAPSRTCKGAETDSWAKFGKETVAGARSGGSQACSGSDQAQYSPSVQTCLPSAQVKSPATDVRGLKWN